MSGESFREECVVQHVKITRRWWCGVTSVFGTGRLHIVQGHMKCKNIVKALDSSAEWVSQQAMPLWYWRPHFHATRCLTVFLDDIALKIYHARVTTQIWILSKIYKAFWSPKCRPTRKPSQTSNAMIGNLFQCAYATIVYAVLVKNWSIRCWLLLQHWTELKTNLPNTERILCFILIRCCAIFIVILASHKGKST